MVQCLAVKPRCRKSFCNCRGCIRDCSCQLRSTPPDEGVPRVTLRRLVNAGVLTQPSGGLYQLAVADLSEAHDLAEAAKAAPSGVTALLSALQFHELTTWMPLAMRVLMPPKAWAPTRSPVQLRIIRASGQALTGGIKHHRIDGVSVPITELTIEFDHSMGADHTQRYGTGSCGAFSFTVLPRALRTVRCFS